MQRPVHRKSPNERSYYSTSLQQVLFENSSQAPTQNACVQRIAQCSVELITMVIEEQSGSILTRGLGGATQLIGVFEDTDACASKLFHQRPRQSRMNELPRKTSSLARHRKTRLSYQTDATSVSSVTNVHPSDTDPHLQRSCRTLKQQIHR